MTLGLPGSSLYPAPLRGMLSEALDCRTSCTVLRAFTRFYMLVCRSLRCWRGTTDPGPNSDPAADWRFSLCLLAIGGISMGLAQEPHESELHRRDSQRRSSHGAAGLNCGAGSPP